MDSIEKKVNVWLVFFESYPKWIEYLVATYMVMINILNIFIFCKSITALKKILKTTRVCYQENVNIKIFLSLRQCLQTKHKTEALTKNWLTICYNNNYNYIIL